MYRVLVIDDQRKYTFAPKLLGFHTEYTTHAMNPRLESMDCVLVWQPFITNVGQRLRQLRDILHPDSIPFVLAHKPESISGLGILEHFDGFVDVRWPEALVAESLQMAISQVRSGVNVIEIQREVIRAARNEAVSLYETSVTDWLTGLHNRRHLESVIDREHGRLERDGFYSLVFLDVDDLKQFNNRFGHQGGTSALKLLGRIIDSSIRKRDYAFRYGGDEFVIMLPEAHKREAKECALRVCKALRNARLPLDDKGDVRLTVSVGIAAYPEDGRNHEEVLKRADEAMFCAKGCGKNRVVTYGEAAQLQVG